MLDWLWYPTKKLRQLIHLGVVIVGVILIGFELRPMWAHLMTKLWISPVELVRECMSLASGIPYVALIQVMCVVIILILALIFA